MQVYIFIAVLIGLTWAEEAVKNPVAEFVKYEEIRSTHLSPFLHSTLSLPPGDLKLFAGHSLNIIKAKCPAVDTKKIQQIQKYIGKMVAVTKDQGSSPYTYIKKKAVPEKTEFDHLLNSITTCTKTPDEKPGELKGRKKPNGGISFIVRNPNGDMTIIRKLGEKKESPIKTGKEEEGVVLGFDDEPVVVHLPAGMGEKPAPTPEDKKKKEEQQKVHSGFIKWASAIFDKVTSFFTSMFTPARLRRSSAEVEQKEMSKESGTKWIQMDKAKGKQAVFALLDEICRLYCNKCAALGPFQIQNFKMAAKELSDFLIKDENVLIAASHLLDNSFLDSLKSCGHIEQQHPLLGRHEDWPVMLQK